MLPAIRVNNQWLQVHGEGKITNSAGRVVARVYDAIPANRQIAGWLFPSMEEQQMNGIEVVPVVVTTKARFAGLLWAAKQRVGSGITYGVDKSGQMLAWLVEKLHLTGLIQWIKSAWSWTANWATRGMEAIGVVGGIGMGLLAVSTNVGRKLLNNTVGKAARLGGRVLGKAYDWTTRGLRHLWAPGKWVADRLDGLVGLGFKGLVKAGEAYDKNLKSHMELDGMTMRVTRVVAINLLAFRLAAIIPNPIISGLIIAGTAMYDLAFGVYVMGYYGVFGAELSDEMRADELTTKMARQAERDGVVVDAETYLQFSETAEQEIASRRAAKEAEKSEKELAKATGEIQETVSDLVATVSEISTPKRATRAAATVAKTRSHRKQPNRKPRRTTAELIAAGLPTRASAQKIAVAVGTPRQTTIAEAQAEIEAQELPSTDQAIKAEARRIADEIITEQEATASVMAQTAPTMTKAQKRRAEVAARAATESAKRAAKLSTRPVPAT